MIIFIIKVIVQLPYYISKVVKNLFQCKYLKVKQSL